MPLSASSAWRTTSQRPWKPCAQPWHKVRTRASRWWRSHPLPRRRRKTAHPGAHRPRSAEPGPAGRPGHSLPQCGHGGGRVPGHDPGHPLVSRIVTVSGDGVAEPRNLEVPIGTPIAELIAFCGGYTRDVRRLLMGGPMMGIALPSDQLPVIKTCNCILAATDATLPPAQPQLPCIRCGECAVACPANLLPQQLYWHAHARDLDAVQEYDLFDCIECGCCAQVCPSHIPLVQYFRYAKTEIWDQEREREKADLARQRHEFRLERLEREKREKAERHKQKRKALDTPAGDDDPRKAAIAAALERVKARKSEADEARPATPTISRPSNSARSRRPIAAVPPPGITRPTLTMERRTDGFPHPQLSPSPGAVPGGAHDATPHARPAARHSLRLVGAGLGCAHQPAARGCDGGGGRGPDATPARPPGIAHPGGLQLPRSPDCCWPWRCRRWHHGGSRSSAPCSPSCSPSTSMAGLATTPSTRP
jgi:formate hydrogenlyase subunit 6/NADH:ubiquinone oxidoreductase subunit I